MAAHTLAKATPSSTSQSYKKHSKLPSFNLRSNSLVNGFVGTKLFIHPPDLRLRAPRRRSFTVATVLSSLPTTKKAEKGGDEKLPKWSARAIKSFALAELEARKLKHLKTGTESLILGILVEGTNLAAKFLRENGITVYKVQDEIVNLLGKGSMFLECPMNPPLTQQAQWALDWAFEEKLKSGVEGEITTTYLLLGVWSVKESAGHKILATLGFDDKKAEELAKSKDKDVCFELQVKVRRP